MFPFGSLYPTLPIKKVKVITTALLQVGKGRSRKEGDWLKKTAPQCGLGGCLALEAFDFGQGH